MHIKIRRTFVVVEDHREEAGRVSNLPLRKVAASQWWRILSPAVTSKISSR